MDAIKELLTSEAPLQVWMVIFFILWPVFTGWVASEHEHKR